MSLECMIKVIFVGYVTFLLSNSQYPEIIEQVTVMFCDQLYILCFMCVRSSTCDAKYEMDHVYEDLVSRATGGKLPCTFCFLVMYLGALLLLVR